jgi:DNA-binding IclR family transcriptional regulator
MFPAQPNQSLVDGLACLQALASAGRPLGSREMARQLGLEPTRVNRLLKTLAALGIAQQNAAKQYVPGPGMHVLAAQATFGSGLMRRALEPLQTLRPHGYSVAMGVLWRQSVCYLYNARPGATPGESVGRLGLYPATRSSIGMVLLARLEEEEVRALYSDPAQVEIPRFPAGPYTLLAELAQTRGQGYAFIQPGVSPSERTLAVAIAGEPAAIAMSGSISPGEVEKLTAALRDVAQRITEAP